MFKLVNAHYKWATYGEKYHSGKMLSFKAAVHRNMLLVGDISFPKYVEWVDGLFTFKGVLAKHPSLWRNDHTPHSLIPITRWNPSGPITTYTSGGGGGGGTLEEGGRGASMVGGADDAGLGTATPNIYEDDFLIDSTTTPGFDIDDMIENAQGVPEYSCSRYTETNQEEEVEEEGDHRDACLGLYNGPERSEKEKMMGEVGVKEIQEESSPPFTKKIKLE